jgi:hypothetical protein
MIEMRAIFHIAVAVLLTACAGPGKPGADPGASSSAGVERARAAAAVANAVRANPSRADSILGAAGYTADSFEKLMYTIAADSAQSAAYAAARTN